MRPWIKVEPNKTYKGTDGRKRTVVRVYRAGDGVIYVEYRQDDLTIDTIERTCTDRRFKLWAARDSMGELLLATGGHDE